MGTSAVQAFATLCIVLLWGLPASDAVLPGRVRWYISFLIDKFIAEEGQSYSTMHVVPAPKMDEKDVGLNEFLSPLILLWNPNISHHTLVEGRLQRCITCGSPYGVTVWNDGSVLSRNPRKLQAIDNIVLLVSAVYICNNNHRLLAHDALVLECFPCKTVIPFVLLHKTGFTREFAETCTSLVRTGLNFYAIETLVSERRLANYEKAYHQYCMQSSVTETIDFDATSILSQCPSNSILTSLFVAAFFADEDIYLHDMDRIPISTTISFDHTFKIASNIGYYRSDKVWVTQYDSLFLVMNADGQIVSWQFTKGTSLEQVRKLLEGLVSHANKQGRTVTTVYVDDCCKVRRKIQTVFGSQTKVKLDIFHAAQRITKTFFKRHPLYRPCLYCLRQIFREHGDSASTRKTKTPSNLILEQNLKEFCSKWSNTPIWTKQTDCAIRNLIKHIRNGCLSEIETGEGTNRNERFHCFLRSFFNKSKIGIILAYSIMSVLIHAHNSSSRIKGKRVTKPIDRVNSCDYSPTRPMGIIPKQTNLQQDGMQHWEIDLSERQLDMELVPQVFSRALQKYNLFDSLKQMKLHNLLKSVCALQPYSMDSESINRTLPPIPVEERLSSCGLVLSPSEKDGNCFFASVTMNICNNLEIWRPKLKQLGIDHMTDHLTYPEILVKKLRQVFVTELTGEREEHYRGFAIGFAARFACGRNYEEEAAKFSIDGYFDSAFGNFMPLAMAESLESNIVIFRVDDDTPYFITPQFATHHTIFLVYYPHGGGHYDAALVYAPPKSSPSKAIKCSCGVNRTEQSHSCCKQVLYSSRCVCLKANMPCTDLCRCKYCNNPHGLRPIQQGIKSRK